MISAFLSRELQNYIGSSVTICTSWKINSYTLHGQIEFGIESVL